MRSIWKLPVLTIAAIAVLAAPAQAMTPNWAQHVPQQLYYPYASVYNSQFMPAHDGVASTWPVSVTRTGPGSDAPTSGVGEGNEPSCDMPRSVVVITTDDPAVCTIQVTVLADPDYNRVIAAYTTSGSAETQVSVVSNRQGTGFTADAAANQERAIVGHNPDGEALTFKMTMTSGLQDGTDAGQDRGEFLGFLKAWIDKEGPVRVEGSANLALPTGEWQKTASVLTRYFDHESRVEKVEITNAAGDVVMSSKAIGQFHKGSRGPNLTVSGTLTPPAGGVLEETYKSQATDWSGNKSSIETFTAKLDAAKPQLSNVMFDGFAVSSEVPFESENDMMEFRVDVSDEGSGVATNKVFASLGGNEIVLQRDGNKFTGTAPRTTGTRQLVVQAVDGVGNVTRKEAMVESVLIPPYTETGLPKLTASTTLESEYLNTSCVDVSFTFRDDETQVDSVQILDANNTLLVQVNGLHSWDRVTIGGDPGVTATKQICGNGQTGVVTVRGEAYDAFSNHDDATLSINFVAPDTTKPTIGVVRSRGRTLSTDGIVVTSNDIGADLTVETDDNGKSGTKLAATLDGKPIEVQGTDSFTADLGTLSNGQHTLGLVATDRAGNSSAPKSIMLEYQTVDFLAYPVMTGNTFPTAPQKGCVSGAVTFTSPQFRTVQVGILDYIKQVPVAIATYPTIDPTRPWLQGNDPGLSASAHICPDDRGSGVYPFGAVAAQNYVGVLEPSNFAITFDVVDPTITGPTVDATTVTDGDEFATTFTTDFRWKLSDDFTGVDVHDVTLDGKPVASELEGNEAGTDSVASAQLAVPAGAHELTLRITDKAGNEATKTVRIVGIAPPIVAGSPSRPVDSAPGAAAGPSGSATGGGDVGIKRVTPKKNTAPSIVMQVVRSKNGKLRATNMLTLRVRASEWSVWDVKIGGTTFVRHALVRAKWRTVTINLGDVTPIGKKLNAAKPGQFMRIPIALQGRDGMSLRSKTRVQYVTVQA